MKEAYSTHEETKKVIYNFGYKIVVWRIALKWALKKYIFGNTDWLNVRSNSGFVQ
jgi:hypothetical protein